MRRLTLTLNFEPREGQDPYYSLADALYQVAREVERYRAYFAEDFDPRTGKLKLSYNFSGSEEL